MLHFVLDLAGDALLGVGVILQILGVAAAVAAIMETRSSEGAIAWSLALITAPWISLPLYLVFGRTKFEGYASLMRANSFHEREEARAAVRAAWSARSAPPPERESDSRVFERIARMPFTGGNAARLLVDGAEAFEAIRKAIGEAERHVLVQSYILRADGIGREIGELLAARAGEGLTVLLLFDEIGSHGVPASWLRELAASGVRIASFHTGRGLRSRFQVNFRNHRKLVVADGRVALLGGFNIGDEYLGGDASIGPWRDTHLRLEGPAAACAQLSFLTDWHWAAEETPRLAWGWEGAPASGAEPSTGVDALVLASGPADVSETCRLFFLQAFASARRRLWIASPYFVPDEPVVEALVLAALRGVDVRILLPERPDNLLAHLAAFSYLPEVEAAGIAIHRYTAGFMHQKVLLVDDDLAAVGSANLDNRSLRLNFELTALARDKDFASEVEAMLTRDFERSRRLRASEFLRRRLGFRAACRAARLFSPIL